MNKKTLVIVATLSVVAAVGGVSFGLNANKQKNEALKKLANDVQEEPVATERKESAPAQKLVTYKPADTNDWASLLAERDAEIERLQEELVTKKDNKRPQRESFTDRMAKMKEEDPEGYAEMIKSRTERQQSMRYDLAERTTTFMDLDTELMTAEERDNHNLLLEKMSTIWTLTDQFQDPEAQPDREAMGELFSAVREARPLMEQERSTMFRQLGEEAGYQGEEAQAFADYVEDVIETTTIPMPTGGRGNRGGGGGGGGGR